MPVRSKADFPDLSRGLDRYEGLQRRSEQGRADAVGRLLAGMDVVPLTDSTGKKFDVIGRRSGGAASSVRWTLTAAETAGQYVLVPGRVYDGDREVEITGLATAFTPASGQAVWLEKSGASYGSDWTLAVKCAAWPGTRYDFENLGGLQTMKTYRKRLMTFHGTAPAGGIPTTSFGAGLLLEQHAGDHDFLAETSLINGSPKAVPVLQLIPY